MFNLLSILFLPLLVAINSQSFPEVLEMKKKVNTWKDGKTKIWKQETNWLNTI